MKKILLTAFAVLGLMTATTSCEDFLDEDVRGQENLDTYFQNAEDAESFVIGCYNSISDYQWWTAERMWILCDMCTDDYWMGNTGQNQEEYISLAHYMGVGQSNGSISDFWQYRYKGILKCNIALDRIPDVPMSETLKNRLLAEARFLRGYFYFELVKNFGGVPLVTGFLMPSDVAGITRSTIDACYDFIEEDFDFASKNLPSRSELNSSETGRATSGAALGLLGKSQVYAGRFDKAKVTLKKLIDTKEYDLMPEFGQNWNLLYENNRESLFEVQNIYDETYKLGGNIPMISGNRNSGDMDGWGWGVPTSDLENAFIEAGDTERLAWTIIKNGATSIPGETNFEGLVKKQGDRNKNGSYYINPADNKSCRVSRKHYIPFDLRPAKFDKENLSPLNYTILRYADVLLLYAEACYETGDENGCRANLNLVRRRVHLDNVTASGTALRDALRLERRLELATETQRLYDIRRWTDDNGKKMACNLFGPNGSFVRYNLGSNADPVEAVNQREPQDKGATFIEGRDLVFPVPLYEVTMSEGRIEQNPGWQ